MRDFSGRALEIFYAVANNRSFSAAAEELFISQSSVSKIIARLEKDLAVRLVDRDSHHVELTPAGRYLHEQLKKLFPQLNKVFSRLEDFGPQVRETLVVTMPATMGKRFITGFSSAHSRVVFELSQTYDPYTAFTMLLRKPASLWLAPSILITSDYLSHIKIMPIHADPVYALLPLEHPLAARSSISAQELEGERIFFHSNHTAALLKALCVVSGADLDLVDLRNELNTRASCLVSIQNGEGICAFYESDLEMISAQKVAVVPIEEGRSCSVVVAYSGTRDLQPLEEEMVEFFIRSWKIF